MQVGQSQIILEGLNLKNTELHLNTSSKITAAWEITDGSVFSWMKSQPRHKCLHRLTYAYNEFYLMILWTRVLPKVICESLAVF